MRHVTLVVPCFDEAARLDARALIDARLPGRRLELVLVDDGSRDRTRELLDAIERARGDTVVVSCGRNLGKAEAVRRGVVDALGRSPDAVGYWDADLSTPLSELPAFVELLESRPELEVVIGSRVKLMGRLIERRAWRHYLGRAFATAASLTLDLPVYDTQCGAKLFRATPLLARVFGEPWRTRWVFDVELLARFMALDPRGPAQLGRSLYELPLTQWTHVPGSKVRPLDFASAALDLATINLAYRRR
jgi:glycosyltransferase involved in cell wall biosynthesis